MNASRSSSTLIMPGWVGGSYLWRSTRQLRTAEAQPLVLHFHVGSGVCGSSAFLACLGDGQGRDDLDKDSRCLLCSVSPGHYLSIPLVPSGIEAMLKLPATIFDLCFVSFSL